MMDLVCVDIEIENPLNELLYSLKKDPRGDSLLKSLAQELASAYKTTRGVEDPNIEEIIESREFFPEIMGLGLFNYISRMNHSCRPNFEVEYVRNNIANLIPLESVSQGEEATISYIDENEGMESRQSKLLKNYGFKCSCPKCVLEGSDTGRGKPN